MPKRDILREWLKVVVALLKAIAEIVRELRSLFG